MSSQLLETKFRRLLSQVEKPARYLGGEVNSVDKSGQDIKLHVALIFPDAYEMGESHIGLKLLYKILNDQPHIWAERVYAPLPDMEAALIKENMPLFSLESRRPLQDFDLIGITLPYELVYTNILTILDRGGVPLLAKDRLAKMPIVLGGGNSAFNPEPVAEFFDAIVVGDGEDLMLPLAEAVLAFKNNPDLSRQDFLKNLTQHQGLYVPQFFDFSYHEDGTIKERHALLPGYEGVPKAIVQNLDKAAYPTSPIVPHLRVIHDRVGVEVQRGCVRACRFCQAGYIYRPERQRSPETIKRIVDESLANTGYEEVSLLSLSVGDYQPLNPLLNELFDKHEKDRVAISLPATRTETLTPEIIQQIKRVRKTGFTIAPEAGTPRMRRIINKGNEREDLMKTVDHVFSQGWRLIKFYYMCGLPFETQADVLGIAEEATLAWETGRRYTNSPKINVSVSSFVPKPFTPFQWKAQPSIAEIEDRHQSIRRALQKPGLAFKHHDVRMSYLEGVFSRGDRRLAKLLLKAYELGARFDEWQEYFNFEIWQEALCQTKIDPDFYVTRPREKEEILPWDHLFTQMRKDFLWQELEAAHDEAFIEDCSTDRCTNCGVCDFRAVKNINYRFDQEDGRVEAHSTRGRKLKDELIQHLNPQPKDSSVNKELENQIRIRVIYSKLGEAAYLSHLELVSTLKRALARAKIPVGFSKGFHPQVKLSLGAALALGQESLQERLDLELIRFIEPQDLVTWMNAVLPPGIRFHQAWILQGKTPSLESSMEEQSYEIGDLGLEFSKLQERIEALLQASELWVHRPKAKKNRQVDVRPFIKEINVKKDGSLSLTTRFEQSRGSVKPREVLALLLGEESSQIASAWVRKVSTKFAGDFGQAA
ncbi:MAG: TIGR03960 family B12-binding radical SAM protein [Deltaproteobacteria bacterium]|nr:TIGR03960 family B12-binding radical SAM protein [Deltaproteobacteria bacterium]